MRFSQRIGKQSIKDVLQVNSIDHDLKNRLWNTILEDFFGKLNGYSGYGKSQKAIACSTIWKEFFKYPIDTIPSYTDSTIYPDGVVKTIRAWFFNAEWYEIYDLVEFLSIADDTTFHLGFTDNCNLALIKEVSGYRILNGRITQITSENEIVAIEEAMASTDRWKSVSTHLRTALDLLSDRKAPDYRNSIKESISAIESFCKIITKDDEATLGKALVEIEKRHSLHKAMKSSFSALYGYTSDSGGIRHALLESDIPIEFEEAKFMLVTCSAFINYLKSILKI